MLNNEEIKRYHEDGYIIPEFQMPENDLLEIEKLHDKLIKNYPHFLNYCPAVLEYEEKFLKYCFKIKVFIFYRRLILIFFINFSNKL